MKFYILGATGFMGSQCVEYLKSKGHEVITTRVDLTKHGDMLKAFEQTKPDVVINFAGVRAYPTVDWCEDNKEQTIAVNIYGAFNAMSAALSYGAYPIQIGSGCVYEGDESKEFTEEDVPNFEGSFYSRSRITMQNLLENINCLQVRIRMPLSMKKHPRNFITKIASNEKVISAPNSVTLIEDLFPALEKLAMTSRPVGILNLTNDGHVWHKDILTMYKKIVDPNHTYTEIPVSEISSVTKTGRSNCLLSNAKAKSLGLSLPELDEKRLEEIMIAYKNSI